MASAAHGYCVGLITPASLAGAVYSQLAVRSTPASLAGCVILMALAFRQKQLVENFHRAVLIIGRDLHSDGQPIRVSRRVTCAGGVFDQTDVAWHKGV